MKGTLYIFLLSYCYYSCDVALSVSLGGDETDEHHVPCSALCVLFPVEAVVSFQLMHLAMSGDKGAASGTEEGHTEPRPPDQEQKQ